MKTGRGWRWSVAGLAAAAAGLVNALAAPGMEWTWTHGAPTPYQAGIYGSRGVAAAANTPGARGYAASWTEAGTGRRWLFGGYGYDGSGYQGNLNDLWRYDAATGRWTWMRGSTLAEDGGTYGTQGVPAAANSPGARDSACQWTDSLGRLWLFGGYGIDGNSNWGQWNDLWMFDPGTGQWTWIKGDDEVNQAGTYGVKGVADPANNPGGRYDGIVWTDGSDRAWIFGGYGRDGNGDEGSLNDLWMFDPASGNWTWMAGDDIDYQSGIYGTQGVPDPANTPGVRGDSAGHWLDAAGNLWLFGGYGIDAYSNWGDLNDLWKFDPALGQWTWINGSDQVYQPAAMVGPGIFDPANSPGAQECMAVATDAAGDVWLFGGYGRDGGGSEGNLNDLWRLDIATGQWAWMMGSNSVNQQGFYSPRGVFDPANAPGGRYSSSDSMFLWADDSGALWLYGGYGIDGYGGWHYLNDLWKYDPVSGNWAWIQGSDQGGQAGVYGTKGVPNPTNAPGCRYDQAVWPEVDGSVMMFGGYDSNSGYFLNDLWRFDAGSGMWTWLHGANSIYRTGGIYGTRGVPAPGNVPGARYDDGTTRDATGRLWMFGGTGNDGGGHWGALNDLWRHDPASDQWTWIAGSAEREQPGVYGAQGVPDPANLPGGRSTHGFGVDASGQAWVFGGSGLDASGNWDYLNDLWKYDPATGQWTWMSGSSSVNQVGVYGVQGVPDPANMPGSRNRHQMWLDAAGRIWVFGGYGLDGTGNWGDLSDLWMFDPASGQWTWVRGPATAGQPGVYGVKGVPDASNTPAMRYDSISWTDPDGRFWMFGGWGLDQAGLWGFLNDLWQLDPATGLWTWMNGSATRDRNGTYGTQGVPDPANTPGGRYDSCWTADKDGNFWLFGGYGYAAAGDGYLNDLWFYDRTANEWTWRGGSNASYASGEYGTRGVPDPANAPGGRYESRILADGADSVWIFGGYGLDDFGNWGYLGDLWRFNVGTDEFAWAQGSAANNPPGVYGTRGVSDPANTPGGRYMSRFWLGAGRLHLLGGYGYDQGGNSDYLNDQWRSLPLVNHLTVVTDGTPGAFLTGPTVQTVVYDESMVPVQAEAPPGCTFTGWAGDYVGFENPLSLTTASLTGEMLVTATFAPNDQVAYLAMAASGNGAVSPEGTRTVRKGATIPIMGTPNSGSRFLEWVTIGAVTVLDPSDPSTTAVATGDGVVVGKFATMTETVLLTVQADPGGSVDPAGTFVLFKNQAMTVAATPVSWYHFTGWTATPGATIGDPLAMTTTVSATQDVSLIATFALDAYTLTYIAGAGGSVNGGGVFTQTVSHGGDGIFVLATPNPGFRFVDWSDGRTDNPRQDLAITGDFAVTANFRAGGYLLTYTAGDGGTIDGASVVTQTVSFGGDGPQVTAIPDDGHTFVAWSDGGTDNPRQDLGVTGDLSVTATFAADLYILTYHAGPNGSVDGAATVTQAVAHGTDGPQVTAIADPTYAFVAWSDGSTDNPRQDLNVTAPLEVTATFAMAEYVVTFRTDGTPGAAVNGEAEITQLVAHGSDCLPVTAAAEVTGVAFVAWTGDYEGTDNPLTLVNITSDMTVTATFRMAQVACGSTFELAAAQAGLDRFRVKPKVYATYTHPVSGKAGKASAKVLTPLDKENGNAVLLCGWTKKVKVYDAKAQKAAEGGGISAAAWITANMADLPMELRVSSKEVPDRVAQALALAVPVIDEIIDDVDAEGNPVLVIDGQFFGTKPPKAWREYEVADGAGGTVVKRQALKVVKPTLANSPYVDGKGKPTCMDPGSGESRVIVAVPDKLPAGPLNGVIVIDNGVGLASGDDPGN